MQCHDKKFGQYHHRAVSDLPTAYIHATPPCIAMHVASCAGFTKAGLYGQADHASIISAITGNVKH